jgi:hypothetical protein
MQEGFETEDYSMVIENGKIAFSNLVLEFEDQQLYLDVKPGSVFIEEVNDEKAN